jgi:cell division protein FtsQ
MFANRRLFRVTIVSFALIVLLSIIAWGVFKLFDPSTFPTRSIKIHGEYSHVSKTAIEHTIAPFVRGSFFDTDIVGIKEQLLMLPWVETVTVKRVWPGNLVIYLQEQKPFAIWNKDKLLSENGVVFASVTNEFVNSLPQLSGSIDEQKQVIQQYKKFTEILSTRDLHIKQLQLTSDKLWVLRTNEGLVIMLGEKDTQARLARFMDVYPKIASTNPTTAQPKYIDLRYSDGVAIKW